MGRAYRRSLLRAKTFTAPNVKQCRNMIAGVGLMACGVVNVHAGAEFNINDDIGINVGFGLRTSYSSLENAAPNGSSYSNSFDVENARLYISGHYGKYLKATFNTERTGGSSASGGDAVRVMDAIVQFELNDSFNFWMGR